MFILDLYLKYSYYFQLKEISKTISRIAYNMKDETILSKVILLMKQKRAVEAKEEIEKGGMR